MQSVPMNRNRTLMNSPNKALGPDENTRSLLKAQHKKIYSICRLFSDNYKELQGLFAATMAAAAQSMGVNKGKEEKNTLFLRACINMAALHALTRRIEEPAWPMPDQPIQFNSPDYQKNMLNFREAVGDIPDWRKLLLFLHFEKVDPAEIPHLSGLSYSNARFEIPKELPKKRFIPYLMDLIWS